MSSDIDSQISALQSQLQQKETQLQDLRAQRAAVDQQNPLPAFKSRFSFAFERGRAGNPNSQDIADEQANKEARKQQKNANNAEEDRIRALMRPVEAEISSIRGQIRNLETQKQQAIEAERQAEIARVAEEERQAELARQASLPPPPPPEPQIQELQELPEAVAEPTFFDRPDARFLQEVGGLTPSASFGIIERGQPLPDRLRTDLDFLRDFSDARSETESIFQRAEITELERQRIAEENRRIEEQNRLILEQQQLDPTQGLPDPEVIETPPPDTGGSVFGVPVDERPPPPPPPSPVIVTPPEPEPPVIQIPTPPAEPIIEVPPIQEPPIEQIPISIPTPQEPPTIIPPVEVPPVVAEIPTPDVEIPEVIPEIPTTPEDVVQSDRRARTQADIFATFGSRRERAQGLTVSLADLGQQQAPQTDPFGRAQFTVDVQQAQQALQPIQQARRRGQSRVQQVPFIADEALIVDETRLLGAPVSQQLNIPSIQSVQRQVSQPRQSQDVFEVISGNVTGSLENIFGGRRLTRGEARARRRGTRTRTTTRGTRRSTISPDDIFRF